MTINKWLTGIWIQNKVVVETVLCKKCYKCTEVCPPEAMEVPEKKAYPMVNQDTCIRCYCCTEVCPESAIQVKGFSTWLQKWRGEDKEDPHVAHMQKKASDKAKHPEQ